jgi:NADPH-dependent curcumin reductase CurA
MKSQRQIMVSRPTGEVKEDDFKLESHELGLLQQGKIRVRVIAISIEPAMRGWMVNRTDYMPDLELGDMLHGFAIGEIIQSYHPEFIVGQLVSGNLGCCTVVDINPEMGSLRHFNHSDVAPEMAMSVLGITGLTAYFGVNKIAKPKHGDTFVVSAAAGAVGSIAGQLAKLAGCTVIGIVGSEEKSKWLLETLAFDHVINYKTQDVKTRLREVTPNGINIYFDNVGGTILDLCLARLSHGARVVLCGGIAHYNATEKPSGPANYFALVHRRASMQGFIVLDYENEFDDAIAVLKQYVLKGKLINKHHQINGLNHLVKAINTLFYGKNQGKVLLLP